jgi:hydroxymethylbilane synthase
MNAYLHGGCQVPIAGYTIEQQGALWMRGLVGRPDGTIVYRAEARGSLHEAEALGVNVAQALLHQGAGDILQEVYGAAADD